MASIASTNGVRRIAVIGAGPGGLAAAKYLSAEGAFSQIDVFEQRDHVGGVWNATPEEYIDEGFTIPRTNPSKIPDQPVWKSSKTESRFRFVSAVYDALETNIPHTMLNYSDQRFPENTSLFPHHTTVLEYLERYADGIRPLLKLGIQILDVRPLGTNDQWSVSSKNVQSGVEITAIYDAVVVANGHYNDPFVPDIPGLKEFNAKYPTVVSHSKFYRRPEAYKDKKVIIIGNSASGIDISAQISALSQKPLLISEKSELFKGQNDESVTKIMPEIAEFIIADRSVRFTNGHIERNVDSIIFCTGYMYSFPFLTSLPAPVVSNGSRAQNLFQQIFYHAIPTLSFIGLPQRIVPFPVSEAQASVIARVLSGRLSLPSQEKMKTWEEDRVAETGAGKAFHILGFPKDAEYINYLHEWSMQATLNPKLQNKGVGKVPPYWGEKAQWVRERILLIKIASRKLGAKRYQVKTLEELGFDYDKWKKGVEFEKAHL